MRENHVERFGALSGLNLPEITPEKVGDDESLIRKLFDENKIALINLAVEAQKDAKHHSNTLVGCSILTYPNINKLEQSKFFSAGNRKLKRGQLAWPKRQCAEMRAIRQALEQGQGFIPAIVTASEKHNTGEADKTGHDIIDPCRQCQGMFRVLLERGVLSPNTQLYNARVNSIGSVLSHQRLSLGLALEHWGENDEQAKDLALQDLTEEWEKLSQEYLMAKIVLKVSRSGATSKILARQEKLVKTNFETKVLRAVKTALEEGVSLNKISQLFEIQLVVSDTATLINSIKEVVSKKQGVIDEIVAQRDM